MPEANQYSFSHKELVEIMVKKAGIHEGKWMLSITFGFGAINSGPSPDQMIPTGVVGVQSIGILKAVVESPEALTVDAAVVNPASTEKTRPSGRSRGASRESS
jgi:hypothetical protein